ncbi:MAG: hypothetical protein H7175_08000 [Burkholderiales bacterium]|nr:hypothetical protein [Anaerolineae bacterium]
MTRPEIAEKAWPVLTAQAKTRQTIEYGVLGQAINFPAYFLGPVLEYILRYCKLKNLPQLQSIVVSKETGKATDWGSDDPSSLSPHAAVFDYEWSRIPPPTAAELDAVYKQLQGQ